MGCNKILIELIQLVCLICVSRANSLQYFGYQIPQWDSCRSGLKVPMWSRGFARMCCDIYPMNFTANYFEQGQISDSTYFINNVNSISNIVITAYVVVSDFPLFLDYFFQLPLSKRVILVTGCEDIGAPYELFHPTRFETQNRIVWKNPPKVTMREFILDPRLIIWFTQNYDLFGCNPYTCSNLDMSKMSDLNLLPKLVPIPIVAQTEELGRLREVIYVLFWKSTTIPLDLLKSKMLLSVNCGKS
ncbi:hypothetical protein CEUSTIGMA_g13791.t1 [Chlamydomonas eustigma]|uniref:Uncharacterized protein n=1 Tax=Chlamydomonas eustigma TaxID=1157962 RepID=A0A250XTS8_9CHLO|nr:hypothetical protein CEUSTIGMA_g13791.t1 [Chlamydomonas eustigma]|eukprot:GAX86379.1 hypothetical protein CEUSTIGMA_g13791.t1 [Chlamydomonas eustigma]